MSRGVDVEFVVGTMARGECKAKTQTTKEEVVHTEDYSPQSR